MTTLNKLIYFFLNAIKRESVLTNKQQLENGVERTMKDYRDTLKFLERYDKREIPQPKRLAKYSGLQDYIRSI